MALSTASVIASSSFLILTEVLILFGNILVILAVAKNKSMQTVTNIFIVNLSLTDLFVAIFNCPLMLLAILANGWIIGDVMCKVSGFLNVVFCCASILTLTAISIDRYYCITQPTKKIITKNKAFCMIASIWLIVFFFAFMPVLGWNEYVYVDDRKHCMIYWQRGGADSAYGIFLSASSFVVPTWIMFFCYYKIFSTARKQAKKFARPRGWNIVGAEGSNKAHAHVGCSSNRVVPSDYNESDATRGVLSSYTNNNDLTLESVGPNPAEFEENDTEEEKDSEQQEQEGNCSVNKEMSVQTDERTWKKSSNATKEVSRDVKERRTARVILIVIGVFQICWLPYAALNQWSAFTGTTPPGIADLAASLLAYFNSGCNAVIYTKFNPKFRKAFAKLLCCGYSKEPHNKRKTKRIQVQSQK
ncbi:beta-1 adrenergic receptor-like [Actinia tenebrosa]|uniref:Beta-1 adrenergic receptor-like n=1 Tax=Actinia tenebrosa TaxID=6105 RepID=A0A6P8IFU5_ACTTE|nr:beta-1 adrenergic receptor-like [Actinia tenebrosa]